MLTNKKLKLNGLGYLTGVIRFLTVTDQALSTKIFSDRLCDWSLC